MTTVFSIFFYFIITNHSYFQNEASLTFVVQQSGFDQKDLGGINI